ncbi:DUF3108 domain-containing protein [Flavobacteriales bacterium]|nr:DUF3108 domain-containing protein [Flavobacteriales bacterium]
MRFFLLIFLSNIFQTVFAQSSELPFKDGEKFEYDIFFEFIKSGTASLVVKKDTISFSKNRLIMVGKGKTHPFFDLFFKVRDEYSTLFNTTDLVPILFNRKISEGNFNLNQQYLFDHQSMHVKSNSDFFPIIDSTQDMLSALFFARTFNTNLLSNNKVLSIPVFMDNEIFRLKIKYLYNEIIKSPFGNVDCLVFQPSLQNGRVFEDEESMRIWISNDESRALLRVEVEIWAGTIKAILKSYEKSNILCQ